MGMTENNKIKAGMLAQATEEKASPQPCLWPLLVAPFPRTMGSSLPVVLTPHPCPWGPTSFLLYIFTCDSCLLVLPNMPICHCCDMYLLCMKLRTTSCVGMFSSLPRWDSDHRSSSISVISFQVPCKQHPQLAKMKQIRDVHHTDITLGKVQQVQRAMP